MTRPLRKQDAREKSVRLHCVTNAESLEGQTAAFTEDSVELLFEHLAEGVVALDTGWQYTRVSREAERLLGVTREDLLGKRIWDVFPLPDEDLFYQRMQQAMRERVSFECERYSAHLGKQLTIKAQPAATGLFVFFREVTRRQRAEEELQRLFQAIEHISDAIGIADASNNAVYINKAFERLYGYTREELNAKGGFPCLFVSGEPACQRALAVQEDMSWSGESEMRTCAGELLSASLRVDTLLTGASEITGLVMIHTSGVERKSEQEQIRRQFERLSALRAIDSVITGSFDLQLILRLFLEQVIHLLKVDAAAILISDPHTQSLEYAATHGFRTPVCAQNPLHLNDGGAGRVARERQPLIVLNIHESDELFVRRELFEQEGFVAYHSVPLISKGQLRGVLEVFHRTPPDTDFEWVDFLGTLAGQAAIAIDNTTLFDELQRSNNELTLAYDATIEGWSRVLDLRDKETEGHSRRVTDMTVKLAREMGIGVQEIVQIRRGALLHDIGKMGIPDNILLKPGPLTEEEWVIMRKHPTYAYEMLSPITFLRPALDIPYCHHEKWDGTGYPRGLKGVQIPMAARLFAIVDVWDALCSDRPYRPGWPLDKVRAHIASLAGAHFDPEVTEAFLRMQF